MKPRALCVLLLAAGTGLYAQEGNSDNPFEDHDDQGGKVHVMPNPDRIGAHRDASMLAPPHQGTAVYPASYGSGNLIDHGGLEIPNASFQPIYWNTSVAHSASTSMGYANLESQIGAFASAFSDSANWDNSTTDDFAIVQQYGSHSSIAASLMKQPDFVDSQSTYSRFKDSQIQTYLTNLFNAHKLAANSSVLYGIYFPAGMQVCLQGGCSCSSFCGYHSHFTYGSTQIKYAVFPYPNCRGCSISGLSAADMLTIVSSHEIREAVTDPGDFNTNAWYDGSGYEADDKCAWHNLYQMSNGGFWVQPEYSNGGTATASGFTATYPGPGCIVPNR
ncbi:MAG TPA: hypothetical protein VKT49_08245 [Bryobacteraceae bacterium]|nr:hypothetical protein [Bryobacteraceae bacterium]